MTPAAIRSRRLRLAVTGGLTLLLLAIAGSGSAPAQPAPSGLRVSAVEAVGMTVSDMDRALDFYTGVLPFEKVSDVEVEGEAQERLSGVFGLRARVVRLRLGDESLELTDYLAPEGRPIPADSRSNDRWFQHAAIVVSDMAQAYGHLRRHKVQHASSGPQRLPDWNKNAGGIEAFYFKDPDGHPLEIIHYPPGKGDARWQQPGGKLFLGIDHTAIVVSDTEASLRFYRDRLGMRVAGESENYGPEQEHLNNVFGARLRITALRASAGPGIEFLEYLAPRDGRAAPPDSKANDLWHWQATLVAPDLAPASPLLFQEGASFVSPGVVDLMDAKAVPSRALQARDPDGHALLLVEKKR